MNIGNEPVTELSFGFEKNICHSRISHRPDYNHYCVVGNRQEQSLCFGEDSMSDIVDQQISELSAPPIDW
jgi:hypothetical protein